MTQILSAFLKSNLLFRNFSDQELALIVPIAESRTIHANTMVFAEESIGNALYMIREGHVKVSKDVEGHGNLPLLVLGPGEFFGEMALVRPGPRLVTVKTLETSEFVIFSKEKWDVFLEQEPLIARKLTDLISNWFLLKLRRSNTEINRFIKWRLDQPSLEQGV
jgi:CRP-like cAMP-binding protein